MHARARAANALGPRQRRRLRLAARVLINRDQRRNAFAFDILTADDVPGPFRRDEDHVHIFRRNDGLEMNRKSVREQQRFALGQIRRDVLLVSLRLLGVRQRHKNHVRLLHRFAGGDDLKSFFPRDRDGLAAFVKADDDLEAAVLEIERVGVAL